MDMENVSCRQGNRLTTAQRLWIVEYYYSHRRRLEETRRAFINKFAGQSSTAASDEPMAAIQQMFGDGPAAQGGSGNAPPIGPEFHERDNGKIVRVDVSRTSIMRTIRKFERFGNVFDSVRHRVGKCQKQETQDMVLAYFKENPHMTLKRAGKVLGLSGSTICRILDRHGAVRTHERRFHVSYTELTPSNPAIPRIPEIDVKLLEFWKRTSTNGQILLGIDQYHEEIDRITKEMTLPDKLKKMKKFYCVRWCRDQEIEIRRNRAVQYMPPETKRKANVQRRVRDLLAKGIDPATVDAETARVYRETGKAGRPAGSQNYVKPADWSDPIYEMSKGSIPQRPAPSVKRVRRPRDPSPSTAVVRPRRSGAATKFNQPDPSTSSQPTNMSTYQPTTSYNNGPTMVLSNSYGQQQDNFMQEANMLTSQLNEVQYADLSNLVMNAQQPLIANMGHQFEQQFMAGPSGTASLSNPTPGDIITQPNTRLIFNAPFNVMNVLSLRVTNPSHNRIGWLVRLTSGERLSAQPAFGVLDGKEQVNITIACAAFNYMQAMTDRLTLQWVIAPDMNKPLRMDWFHYGVTRSKNVSVEYND